MPSGRCGLCLQERELRSSHLLPAGVYAIIRSGTVADHLVFATPRVSVYSDLEVQAYLLCDECEDRFNRQGEDWTLEHCWRAPTEFRLRDALERAVSVEPTPGYHVFAGTEIAGVEMRKLVYFGASVFWRAAACRWRIDKGPAKRLMTLGPCEEPLRQFLLTEGELPAGIALLVFVNVSREARLACVAEFPMAAPKDSSRHRTYRLTIPGLTFVMFVGREMPSPALSHCASRTGSLIMAPYADVLKLQHILARVNTVPRRGKLRRAGL